MCGISAIIGIGNTVANNNYMAKRKFVEQSLFLNTLRGMEGTGLAMIDDPHKAPIIYKRALAAPDFIQLYQSQQLLMNVDKYQVALCHTRSATRGSSNDDNNAHPFQYDHITMIHNGTCPQAYKWRDAAQSDVDSAQLTCGIAQEGAKAALESVGGDFACVWHDAKEGTINVCRNDGRPLYWAYIPEWEAYTLMSEWPMLASVLDRIGVRILDKFWYPKVNTIYTFKIGAGKNDFTMLTFVPVFTRSRASPGGNRTDITVWKPDTGTDKKDISASVNEIIERSRGRDLREQHPNSLRPHAPRSVIKAKKKLDKKGLSFEQMVAADPQHWIPYREQPDFGYIVGLLKGIKWKGIQFEVHRVDRATWNELVVCDFIFARAVNIRDYGKGEQVVILELDKEYMEHSKANDRIFNTNADKAKLTKDAKDLLLYLGPKGEDISLREFKELTKDGCAHCCDVINPNHDSRILWVGEYKRQPLCPSCATNSAILEKLGIIDKSYAPRNNELLEHKGNGNVGP
jgi:predicted glutamine amidotransferase